MLEKILPTNEGWLDRGLRIGLGLGLLALTLTGPRTAWGFVGLLPLLTGLLGSCPLYTALGLNSCPRKSRKTIAA